jgi:hypothetical protein
MSALDTIAAWLSARRDRRRRYRQTLEFLSLPAEIQRDVARRMADAD